MEIKFEINEAKYRLKPAEPFEIQFDIKHEL